MDYERNMRYFSEASKISQKGVLISGLIGLALFNWKFIYGFLVFAAVGGYIYLKIKGRVKDAEIDSDCEKMVSEILSNSLEKVGIDEDEIKYIEPVVIKGHLFDNVPNRYRRILGKDGRQRSSNYQVTILYFTEDQLHVYRNMFSIIVNKNIEIFEEYFYRHIVSMTTSGNYLRLVTSGGDTFECLISDMNDSERSIRAMKNLIREKGKG